MARVDRAAFEAALHEARENPGDARAQGAAAVCLYAMAELVAEVKRLRLEDDDRQAAVVHAWQAWARGAACTGSAWSWAFAVIHRRYLDMLRSRAVRRAVVVGDDDAVVGASAGGEGDMHELLDAVRKRV